MRVLHGPVNIGNQPWVLSRAERRLGLDSDLVVVGGNWLSYRADRRLGGAQPGTSWRSHAARVAFGATAPFQYDVLHYYFGSSYIHRTGQINPLGFADLKLARSLGRRVFMTLQGCDARLAGVESRQSDVTMCRNGACALFNDCIERVDKVRRHLIDVVLPDCDRVFYLNPDLRRAGVGQFMPYANCDIDAVGIALPSNLERPLIVHAPTDRGIKGSNLIEAALDQLAGRFAFDYRTVTGLPHAEAMKLYKSADLIIDQVLAGWYGGFAVEAMAMGKPVAAYIRAEDLGCVPPAMVAELPILRLDPRTLDQDLERIFADRQCWSEIGERSRAYVERWHNPLRIATALRRCYEVPSSPFELSLE